MHILYVNKVSPRFGGGAETRILEVGKRLVAKGHRVTIVCAATEEHLPLKETWCGLDIEYIRTAPGFLMRNPSLRFYSSRLPFFFLSGPTVDRMASNGVDVIRDDIAPFPSIPAVRIGHRRNIPLMATVHNLGNTWKRWRGFYGTVLGSIGYLGERWLRRTKPYDFVVSDSEWMRRSLEGDLTSERIAWIPNGVDQSVYTPGGERPVVDRNLNLFYAARFVQLKGHKVLIEALSRIRQAGVEVKLHLAGTGPLFSAAQHQVRSLGLQGSVVFYGSVQKSAMPELYRRMDIFVFPSFFEGLPVTILEAMASGLPIVAARIDAVEGVLDAEHSLLVEPGDPQAMAAAVLRLAGDGGLRRRFGMWGRREVETKYTWEGVTEQELSVYEQVMGRHKMPCENRSASEMDSSG